MRLTKHNILTALAATGLCLGVASAQAGYLLNENFDDGSATYVGTGPVSSAATGSRLSTNIRAIADDIYTGVNNGFSLPAPAAVGVPGFSGSFLVLGDYIDTFNGGDAPVGPVENPVARPATTAEFSLGIFGSGMHTLGISFDYVFDTSLAPTGGASSPDDFFVRLFVNGAQFGSDLLFFDGVTRNDTSRRGHFSDTIDFSASGEVALVFGLIEYNITGDSAVGIDNISVVPEPDSMALLAIGLLGLGAARRRKLRAD